MRAVNLIPTDSGRSGSGGIGPYLLLGVLALLVVGALAYVTSHNAVVERRAQLASLETQAQAVEAQASEVLPYRRFATLAQERVQTVRALGETRFDWHRAFADLATVIPDDVWLTSLLGTVTSGVTVDGASSGSTGTLRGVLPNPAIELTGCTTGQDNVARMISRLRLMAGVQRVTLADTTKDEGSSSADCRYGNPRFPQFDIVIFFDALPAPPAAPQSDASASTDLASATPAPSATPTPSTGGGSSTGSDMR